FGSDVQEPAGPVRDHRSEAPSSERVERERSAGRGAAPDSGAARERGRRLRVVVGELRAGRERHLFLAGGARQIDCGGASRYAWWPDRERGPETWDNEPRGVRPLPPGPVFLESAESRRARKSDQVLRAGDPNRLFLRPCLFWPQRFVCAACDLWGRP